MSEYSGGQVLGVRVCRGLEFGCQSMQGFGDWGSEYAGCRGVGGDRGSGIGGGLLEGQGRPAGGAGGGQLAAPKFYRKFREVGIRPWGFLAFGEGLQQCI